MSDKDPEKLRINDLKSALAAAGVELPPTQQKKSFYVDLYQKHIINTGKETETGKKRSRTDGEESERKSKRARTEEPLKGEEQQKTPNPETHNVPESQSQSLAGQATSQPVTTQPSATQPEPNTQPARAVPISNGTQAARANTFQRRVSRRQSLSNGAPARGGAEAVNRRRSTPFPPARYQTVRNPEDSSARRRTIANTQYQQPIFMSPELLPGNQLRYDRSSPSSYDSHSTATQSLMSQSGLQMPKKSPVRSLMMNLMMILGWLIFFIAVIMAVKYPLHIYQTPAGKQYCDSEEAGSSFDLTEEPSDCQPCPVAGYCAAGRLIACAPGFEMKSGICVEDEELSKAALTMIEHMQEKLSLKAGKVECGELENSHVNKEDLETELQELSVHPAGRFSESFAKAREMIAATPSFDLKEATIGDGIVFYSSNPRLPYLCKLQRKAQENQNAILFASAFLILMFIGNTIKNKRAKRRDNVEFLVGHVMNMVREQPRIVVVIRDELSEKHKNLDVMGLWPDVEKRIMNDSRIVESVASGNKRFWEWNDLEPRQLSYNSTLLSEGDSLVSEIETSTSEL